jgi:hypothetical protein
VDPNGTNALLGIVAVGVVGYELYKIGKDWYDRATAIGDKINASNNVMNRIDQSNANNSAGGKFCPADGKGVSSTNPLTGRPYIIDQINQYHSDISSNVPDAFTIADPTPFLPGGGYENGKYLGKMAH